MNIEARLSSLERVNQRLKWTLIAAFLLSCFAIYLGLSAFQNKPSTPLPQSIKADSISVKMISIEDEDGRRRMTLYVVDGKSPRLSILDKQENAIATLGLTAEGKPALSMKSPPYKSAIYLGIAEKANPSLIYYDRDGSARLMSFLTEDGLPFISLDDSNGATRAMLTLDEPGTPSLFFNYNDESIGIEFGGSDLDDYFHLNFFGRDGRSYWIQPPVQAGSH